MKLYIIALLGCLVAISDARTRWSNNDLSNSWRVVGGRDAKEGEFPYQISLRYDGDHLCGGSIVDKEWIITAAHCVASVNFLEFLTVTVGSIQLESGGMSYQVRNISYHPNFSFETVQNDIAILRVDPIEFDHLVQPIAIEKDDIGSDVPVTLSGWGSTSFGSPFPEILQVVNLKTVSNANCSASHSLHPVTELQVCTLTKVGEGACNGDSGGPLVTGTKESGRKLLGIVSWAEPCAEGIPDVFTRTKAFIAWLNGICNCNL